MIVGSQLRGSEVVADQGLSGAIYDNKPFEAIPITTSLLPILIFSLATLLYTSSPPETDCPTFSFLL
jgi:hypothetical protein